MLANLSVWCDISCQPRGMVTDPCRCVSNTLCNPNGICALLRGTDFHVSFISDFLGVSWHGRPPTSRSLCTPHNHNGSFSHPCSLVAICPVKDARGNIPGAARSLALSESTSAGTTSDHLKVRRRDQSTFTAALRRRCQRCRDHVLPA